MYPVLFWIGNFPIHTYGAMIALGFVFAIATILILGQKEKLDLEKTLDLTFWLFLVGLVGARLLYVLTRWQDYSGDWLGIFKVWEGGLVFFGGPLAALPFGIWYFKKNKLPAWKTADVLIPALTINHALGRVGCLGAGCCYGSPTGNDFGIRLDLAGMDSGLRNTPLHPTQLYEFVGLMILFLGLIAVQRFKKFDGQVVLTYFLVYPILRSIVEVFRGDTIRGFLIEGVLSTSQAISILVFIGAAVVLKRRLGELK
jgi:phosphatidylglycerol:prolipoprotein diacylglycerol transferase